MKVGDEIEVLPRVGGHCLISRTEIYGVSAPVAWGSRIHSNIEAIAFRTLPAECWSLASQAALGPGVLVGTYENTHRVGGICRRGNGAVTTGVPSMVT